jgi:hypothetical protein
MTMAADQNPQQRVMPTLRMIDCTRLPDWRR